MARHAWDRVDSRSSSIQYSKCLAVRHGVNACRVFRTTLRGFFEKRFRGRRTRRHASMVASDRIFPAVRQIDRWCSKVTADSRGRGNNLINSSRARTGNRAHQGKSSLTGIEAAGRAAGCWERRVEVAVGIEKSDTDTREMRSILPPHRGRAAPVFVWESVFKRKSA
ncbi:hypothetical protein [Nitrosovibrio tenuis]|uniref:hypothetical protein n=1 Tax=Nitrosovibrio tenuis TaxID=1233 RepID=UPI00115FEB97|nr:hypothetical protein [Nitrosovibrio tenuis]